MYMTVGWIDRVINNNNIQSFGGWEANGRATNQDLNEMLRSIWGAWNIMNPIQSPLPQINQESFDRFMQENRGGLWQWVTTPIPWVDINTGLPNMAGAGTVNYELPELDVIDITEQTPQSPTFQSMQPWLRPYDWSTITEAEWPHTPNTLSDFRRQIFTPRSTQEQIDSWLQEAEDQEPTAFDQFILFSKERLSDYRDDVNFFYSQSWESPIGIQSLGDLFIPWLWTTAWIVNDLAIKLPDYYRHLDNAVGVTNTIVEISWQTFIPEELVDELKESYSNATWIPSVDIDTEEMFNILDRRNIVLNSRGQKYQWLQEMFAQERSEEEIHFEERQMEIDSQIVEPYLNNISEWLAEQNVWFAQTIDTLNETNFAIRKTIWPALTILNSIDRMASEYEESFGEPSETMNRMRVESQQIYDTYVQQVAQYAERRALLWKKWAAEKINELGYGSIREFMWWENWDEFFWNWRLMTPYEFLEMQRTIGSMDLIRKQLWDAILNQDFTPLEARKFARRAVTWWLTVVGLWLFWADIALTHIKPWEIYRADAWALAIIWQWEVKGSLYRFWNDIYRNLDEVIPTIAWIVTSISAWQSVARLNPSALKQQSVNIARRLNKVWIRADAQSIENSLVRSRNIQDIMRRNMAPSLWVETSVIWLDRESDRAVNQDLILWWAFVFDTLLPVWWNAIKEVRRAPWAWFTDAYQLFKQSAKNTAWEMWVESIDWIADTLDMAYHSMAKSVRDQLQSWSPEAIKHTNEFLKKKYAEMMARNMDAFKAWIIGRSNMANAMDLGRWLDTTRAPIDPEAIRYAESVLADIRNTWKNVADMIKVDLSIPWVVTFWPYKSSVLIAADLGGLASNNYNIPQNILRIASPDEVRQFNPNQVVTTQQINQIRKRASDETWADVVLEVFDNTKKSQYFNRVSGWYRLNQDGIDALWITKINPDINDVWLNAWDVWFYQALRDANETTWIYPWNIDALQRSRSFENVESIVNNLVPC